MINMIKYFSKVVIVLTLVSMIFGCGGGGGGSVNPDNNQPIDSGNEHGGSITISANSMQLNFDLSGGYLRGILSGTRRIVVSEIESVQWNSDRIGWKEHSTASVPMAASGTIIIPRTSNNDKGTWTAKLKTGEFLWFNIDMWDIGGVSWMKENDQVRYGIYTVSTVSIAAPGTAIINFGCNLLVGFMSTVDPSGVAHVQWNSDRVGWGDNSVTRGTLSQDANGNYVATISGLPNNDIGIFSFKLSNGSYIWINLGYGWQFGTNLAIDRVGGLITYIL